MNVFFYFDFWGRGTGKRWSDFGSPFCCSRYFCLWSFLVHFSVCTLLIPDPFCKQEPYINHTSFAVFQACLVTVCHPSGILVPLRAVAEEDCQTGQQKVNTHRVELNIAFKTTDLHHPVVLKSRHHGEYHWASPESPDKSLAGNIYTLLSLLLFKNGWDRMQWALCWQHLHGRMM